MITKKNSRRSKISLSHPHNFSNGLVLFMSLFSFYDDSARFAHFFYCPRWDFTQKAKSRGGTLVTRAYIKESTYSWNIQSYSQYRKISICLNRGREESVGNDDVSCIYLTYCMEYLWKSSLWIGIFQRATQDQEYYWPTIYRAGAAVVSTITNTR